MGAVTLLILILTGLSLALSALTVLRDKPPVWRFAPIRPVPQQGKLRCDQVFAYDIATGQAHAPALLISQTGFELLWFEGSAEAQADVNIHAAQFERVGEDWIKTAQGTRITPAGLGSVMEPEQLVVTLGNCIENESRADHIYTTVVSVGGWAMASVADVKLAPEGPLWARKLNLSPILNRSHLVKSPMIPFADGTYALPAYFEMGSTYGNLVRLDAQGHVRDVARMTGPSKPIQPMIVPLDEQSAVAFLRDFDPSGQLLRSETTDGGQSWSEVTPLNIPNPSAPVAALPLGSGRILMVANDDPEGGDRLSLLLSDDGGKTFDSLQELEPNGAGARYPMLRGLEDGTLLLAYSLGNKTGLRVMAFNLDWVFGA